MIDFQRPFAFFDGAQPVISLFTYALHLTKVTNRKLIVFKNVREGQVKRKGVVDNSFYLKA